MRQSQPITANHSMKRTATKDVTMGGTLLRRADQAAVAGLSLVAMIAMAGYWFVPGGASGRLIEIDRAPRQSAEFLVDINRADWPEFCQLPGVGETLARRIVQSRTERGRFVDHNSLRRVSGI